MHFRTRGIVSSTRARAVQPANFMIGSSLGRYENLLGEDRAVRHDKPALYIHFFEENGLEQLPLILGERCEFVVHSHGTSPCGGMNLSTVATMWYELRASFPYLHFARFLGPGCVEFCTGRNFFPYIFV